jgi:hypothetical protein
MPPPLSKHMLLVQNGDGVHSLDGQLLGLLALQEGDLLRRCSQACVGVANVTRILGTLGGVSTKRRRQCSN